MSGKRDKKIQKEVRKHTVVQSGGIAIAVQDLVLGCGFLKRVQMAWRIVWKRAFLG